MPDDKTSALKNQANAMRRFLAEDFGINSDEELYQAIKTMKKANLAVMIYPYKEQRQGQKESFRTKKRSLKDGTDNQEAE